MKGPLKLRTGGYAFLVLMYGDLKLLISVIYVEKESFGLEMKENIANIVRIQQANYFSSRSK